MTSDKINIPEPIKDIIGSLHPSERGKARASVLTPEQRSEIARKAVRTRWAKKKGTPLEEDEGQVFNPLRQDSGIILS